MSNYHRVKIDGGTYFFTIALQDRSKDYLVRYIDILRYAYQKTKECYPFETVAICILPEHIHWLMYISEKGIDYSIIISHFKRLFSQNLPVECRNPNASQMQKRELGVWQRRFWEHLIRNEQDLKNHMDYIYYNPVKHGYVNRVQDWKYSSFHQDVKQGLYPVNWGGNDEMNFASAVGCINQKPFDKR